MNLRRDFQTYNNYPSGNNPWEIEEIDGGSPWRKILVVLLVVLVLAGAAAAAWFLLRDRLFDSPERAAEEWTEVFIEGDTERLLDLTCNDQIWIANARAAADSVPALLEVVPIVDMLDLASMLPGVNFDALLDDIEFDLSNLDYSAPEDATGRTIVAVTGQLRLKLFGDAWFGVPFDERWNMVEESGNWRWCGRETPPAP